MDGVRISTYIRVQIYCHLHNPANLKYIRIY